MSQLRARKDLDELQNRDCGMAIFGCSVRLHAPTERSIQICITPDFGSFGGSALDFVLELPHNYPFAPPRVHCKTGGVRHPHIDSDTGAVHLVLTQPTYWCPGFLLSATVGALQLLFHLDSPEIADIYELAPPPPSLFDHPHNNARRVSLEALRDSFREQLQLLRTQDMKQYKLAQAASDVLPPTAPAMHRSHKKRPAPKDDGEEDEENTQSISTVIRP